MQKLSILIALALAAGCGDNGNKAGNRDMAADGVDLASPADMTDVTPIPAPTTKHIGSTGTTFGLVATDKAAAYLLNPTGTPATGELHVVTTDGTDTSVATGVGVGTYGLAPDSKSILWLMPDAAGTASLNYLDLSTAGAMPKTVIPTGVYTGTLAFAGFFAPSGHYFLVGVLPANVGRSPDLHVIDLRNGMDVYDRPNGEFDYLELVLPDDTLIFQDTAGGQGTGGAPPVQTLYWVSLPNATAAPAVAINSRTTTLSPTADNKTLVFQRTNADLYAWDLTARSGMGTKIASGVITYALGNGAKGPIAYIGADRSVHVVSTDGSKLLDVDATAAADLTSPVILAPDAGDVYYFQNVDSQDNRGTLMRVAVASGATPSKVGDKISTADVRVTDSALVLLQNVDDLGQFGDAVVAKRDGSGITALGMKVPVGTLQAVNPGPDTWFALHLSNAAIDMTNVPIDGSAPVTGKLMWADYTGAAELQLDATAHLGAFAFSDDGRDAVYLSGVAWNATAMNFAGSLQFLATRAPSTAIDGMLAGVTELGPVVNRALFVNAPLAPTAGIYYVTY
jgi:hypothetical protein